MQRFQINRRAYLAHALVPLLFAGFFIWMPLHVPLYNIYSQSYIDFAPSHNLIYPIFLSLINGLFGDYELIPSIQVAFFALSCFYLSLNVHRNTNNIIFGFLAGWIALFNPIIWEQFFTISPYAFFISLSLLMIGYLLSAMSRPNFLSLAGFGICIGLCIGLLPLGWSYLPLILICAPFFSKKRSYSFFKAFFIPAILCTLLILFESSVARSVHYQSQDQSSAPHFFASAALMDSQQFTPYAPMDPRTEVWNKLEKEIAPVRNQIWQTTDFEEREILLKRAMKQTYGFAAPDLAQTGMILDKSANEIRMDIATARIVQDPFAFLEITVDYYRSLWSLDNKITYPFWAFTLLCTVIGLWHWLKRTRFNPLFAACFISSLAIQGLTIWIAHTGLGPDNVVALLSPYLNLSLCSALFGFYTSFINPIHQDA